MWHLTEAGSNTVQWQDLLYFSHCYQRITYVELLHARTLLNVLQCGPSNSHSWNCTTANVLTVFDNTPSFRCLSSTVRCPTMLRITDVGINDAPVVLVAVATEFGSWLAGSKPALTAALLYTHQQQYEQLRPVIKYSKTSVILKGLQLLKWLFSSHIWQSYYTSHSVLWHLMPSLSTGKISTL